jgi:hypothetical protein
MCTPILAVFQVVLVYLKQLNSWSTYLQLLLEVCRTIWQRIEVFPVRIRIFHGRQLARGMVIRLVGCSKKNKLISMPTNAGFPGFRGDSLKIWTFLQCRWKYLHLRSGGTLPLKENYLEDQPLFPNKNRKIYNHHSIIVSISCLAWMETALYYSRN